LRQNREWNQVTSKDKNFSSQKPGYKDLIDNIKTSSKKIQKTKNGVSLFQD